MRCLKSAKWRLLEIGFCLLKAVRDFRIKGWTELSFIIHSSFGLHSTQSKKTKKMNALKIVLLFAVIGLGYAQDGPGLLTPPGLLSQIAHSLENVLEDYFKNSDGNPHVERRVYRKTFDGPEDLDEEELEKELRRFFPDADFKQSPSAPRGGRPHSQRRGNSKPSPDLKLNKAEDCNCRLRTKSRIVNGQEATPNR